MTIAHRKAIDVTRAAARRAGPGRRPARRPRPRRTCPTSTSTGPRSRALPPKQRQAVAYHYLAGLPYAEIAAILGGSTDAARAGRRRRHRGAAHAHPTRGARPDDTRPSLGRLSAVEPSSDDWAGCGPRLAAAAEAEGILDVAYRTVDTPVGPLLLAATEQGLVRVAYPTRTTTRCCRRWPTGSARASCTRPAGSTRSPGELDEYFAGRRRSFDLPLDWRLSTGFRRPCCDHLPPTRLRPHRQLRRAGRAGRQPEGGPRGRHRLRDQPAAGRRALPPGGALRRRDRRLRRRRRGQAHPAARWRRHEPRSGAPVGATACTAADWHPGRGRARRARLRA